MTEIDALKTTFVAHDFQPSSYDIGDLDMQEACIRTQSEQGRPGSKTKYLAAGMARTMLSLAVALIFGLAGQPVQADDVPTLKLLPSAARPVAPTYVAHAPFRALSGCAPPLRTGSTVNLVDGNATVDRDIDRPSQETLTLAGHYALMSQANGDTGTAASGILRLGAEWTRPTGRSSSRGSLVVTVDHRHEVLRNRGLAGLQDRIGYVGVPSLFFNDVGTAILDLYWKQEFDKGRTAVVVGRYDPNDYLNMLGYAHPWASFSNAAVLFDASLAVPDSSWGIGAMHFINDEWYALGMVNDVNGSQDDRLDFFRDGPRFFTLGEIGWSPSRTERCRTNWNVSVWHADPKIGEHQSSGKGLLFSASWMLGERLASFLRVGVSTGGASTYDESLSLGLLYERATGKSLLGLGLNVGKPSTRPSKRQKTVELFYRIQLTEKLTVTPSVQLLMNPAMRDGRPRVSLVGLRIQNRF